MRCKEAQIRISMQIDGELTSRDEKALEQHLHACPRCSGMHTELISLHRAMALWVDEDPSPVLAQSFAHKLAHLNDAPWPARPRRLGWAMGTVAACAVLSAALSVIFSSSPVRGPIVVKSPAPRLTAKLPVLTQPEQPAAPSIQPKTAPEEVAESVTVSATAPSSQRAAARRYRPRVMQVAANPFPQYHEYSSRSGLSLRESKDLISRKMARAVAVEGDASQVVSNSLAANSLAMNETMEVVRGTLRKAVDRLAVEPAAQTDNAAQPGGKAQ